MNGTSGLDESADNTFDFINNIDINVTNSTTLNWYFLTGTAPSGTYTPFPNPNNCSTCLNFLVFCNK